MAPKPRVIRELACARSHVHGLEPQVLTACATSQHLFLNRSSNPLANTKASSECDCLSNAQFSDILCTRHKRALTELPCRCVHEQPPPVLATSKTLHNASEMMDDWIQKNVLNARYHNIRTYRADGKEQGRSTGRKNARGWRWK